MEFPAFIEERIIWGAERLPLLQMYGFDSLSQTARWESIMNFPSFLIYGVGRHPKKEIHHAKLQATCSSYRWIHDHPCSKLDRTCLSLSTDRDSQRFCRIYMMLPPVCEVSHLSRNEMLGLFVFPLHNIWVSTSVVATLSQTGPSKNHWFHHYTSRICGSGHLLSLESQSSHGNTNIESCAVSRKK